MAIVGFFYDKILGERKKNQLKGDIKIKNDVVIQSISQLDTNTGSKKQDIVKVNFEFITEYQPSLGNLTLSGHLLISDTPDNMKLMINMWKKEKKIPQQFALPILNTILIKSNIKALELSQLLNLPPHIKLPILLPKQEFKNYIG